MAELSHGASNMELFDVCRPWAIGAMLLAACGSPVAPTDVGAPGPDGGACGWRAGPALSDQREGSPAFLLADGRVLLVGGHFRYRPPGPLDTSEILDTAAGTSMLSGSFGTSRTNAGIGGTVALADGRIWSGSPWTSSSAPAVPAEIWDPATGSWIATGTQGYGGGPAAALPDGRVLVAGGIDWDPEIPIARSEVWDPATGAFSDVGPMTTPRVGHQLAIVGRRAIAAGGFAVYGGGEGLTSSEVFDAASGTWGEVRPTTVGRGNATSLVLSDGRWLITGGGGISGGFQEETAAGEIYDPSLGAWSGIAPMTEPRRGHVLVELADGRVLAAGGAQDRSSHTTSSAEIWDPRTDRWTPTAPMLLSRGSASAVRLQTGEVLVAGGWNAGLFTSEIYGCD